MSDERQLYRLRRTSSTPISSSSTSPTPPLSCDDAINLNRVFRFNWKEPLTTTSSSNSPTKTRLDRRKTFPTTLQQQPSITVNDTIELNIGGVRFTTSALTLAFEECSKLTDLSSIATCKDSQNRFFIDRDGASFAIILDYLRHGELKLPSGFHELEKLKEEAEFYDLKSLVRLINQQIELTVKSPIVISYSGSYITLTEHSAFNNRHREHVDVGLRKVYLITVAGYLLSCRKVFGITLNMDRESIETQDRYSCRIYLTHTNTTKAFELLKKCGYTLVTSNNYQAADKTSDKMWTNVTNFIFGFKN